MNHSESYQEEYELIKQEINYKSPEDVIPSLCLLIDYMIKTIKYLEHHIESEVKYE